MTASLITLTANTADATPLPKQIIYQTGPSGLAPATTELDVNGVSYTNANPKPVADASNALTAAALGTPSDAAWTAGNGTAISFLKASAASLATIATAARSETIWTDDTGAFFIRIESGSSIAWTKPDGTVTTAPGTGARPAAGVSMGVDASRYQATAVGTGFVVGDYLSHVVTYDPSTGVVIANFWLNVTKNTTLASAPSSAAITPISPLAANAAQETGGVLANIYASLASILTAASNKFVGAANLATSQATVASAGQLIVAARTGPIGTGRISVTLYNTGAATVYIGNTSAVSSTSGAYLPAGASMSLDTTSAIYGTPASGSSIISVTETF